MEIIRSFPPIVDQNARILILGTMPGVESLKKNQYYGHPQNQFWNIVHALFNQTPSPDYKQRVAFLLSHYIAVWDVLATCERQGSLDADIRNEQMNDIPKLLETYQGIQHIMFNGGKAEQWFIRHFKNRINRSYTLKRLPSSSPAHTKKYVDKLQEWLIIKEYLAI